LAITLEVAVVSEATNPGPDLLTPTGFSDLVRFDSVVWNAIPAEPGVYVVFDRDECLYVGMAGRDGAGTLRKRLRDHSTGQVVNMFAQYLFLARVQFLSEERITHPRRAKAACRAYILERCSFRYLVVGTAAQARSLEGWLKRKLLPALNGPGAT
jgi:excinuclease UvrABC nuclease subunit